MKPITRRQFFALSAAFSGFALAEDKAPRRPKVAAIYTVCQHRSHAHVILEKFLRPFLFNGKRIQPPVDMVSFYADQRPAKGDMTDDVARQFKIPVYKTIADALTLGGKELAVDAVLSIGEHGTYRRSKLDQVEYPRKRFFDEIIAVMRKSNRYVPLFNDKHLSFRWDWAREMYDTCRKHKIPFMAGSSVPLAQRRPVLEIPAGSVFEEAVSIHGGGLESYDFHGLEVLQSLVEFRKGGETGVSSIEFLAGDALFKAAQQGRWSLRLAQAAMAAEFDNKPPDIRRPIKGERPAEPHGILITYRDGLRATMLKIGNSSVRWNFACKLAREERLRATHFYVGPWNNRCLFMALCHAIQQHFVERRPPYPVERTLLATGMVAATMRSRADGRRLQTPELHLAYEPRDFSAFREMGASWKIMKDRPEPRGINPIGEI